VYLALQTVMQRYFDRAIKSAEEHKARAASAKRKEELTEVIRQLNTWRDQAYGKAAPGDPRQKSSASRNPAIAPPPKNAANR
jgi:hypothetical protein